MQYDILITHANLYFGKGRIETDMDVAVADGKIAARGKNLDVTQAAQVIDATGKLLSPGFIDSHMHIDLSYTYDYETKIPSLIGGAKQFHTLFDECASQPREQLFDAINARSAATVEACAVNGTTTLKHNVTYTNTWDTLGLDSALYIKERYQKYCSVLNCVSFSNPIPPELDPVFYEVVLPYYEQAGAAGKVDFVSGYPHKHPDGKAVIDGIFAYAEKYDRPIDIHCDETDVPLLTCFDYVTKKTAETGMNGQVSCGHVTGLSSHDLSDDTAKRLIEQAAAANVHVTSLTSCNLFLMNRNRRGPTRVRQLLDAGVNVSCASDDIREILRPFGSCDMLEEALLTAQVHKMGTTALLRQAFDMATYNPARNCLLRGYGLEDGCDADLVLLAAPSPELALLDQAKKSYVIKNGAVIAADGKLLPGFLS